jgi:arabinogalactan endo-1,4-beta-galactosidase
MRKGMLTIFVSLFFLGLASCGASTSSGEINDSSSDEATSVDWSGFSSYEPGTSTNDEAYDYDDIIVNTPTNVLNSDFAYGVDCSIVHEIESLGGIYYNENGEEEDVFKILANDGVNYVRLRLWMDPYNDETGAKYGGGTNDLRTDIYLASRAKAAGLKVMIDFHYSDFWVDPSHYYAPKAWAHILKANLPSYVYDYTEETLLSFKNEGVTVDSVQIGNEINTGIAGVASGTGTGICAKMVVQGIAAAKTVFPDIQTIAQLTNIKSTSAIYEYFDNLISNGADFDIAGVSYYPYWHGTKSNLQTVLNTVAENTGKPVMICETSWGFTDDQTDYATNQYSTSGFGQTGGYLTSPQGQATEMADLIDILSKVPDQKGLGIFYWEPDWLPVEGSYWATKAGEYYNDNGKDADAATYEAAYTDDSQKQSWANQAWFSYTGKALPSAATYKHILNGDKTTTEVISGLVKTSLTETANIKDSWSLPTTVQGYTNTGAYRDIAVTWDRSEEDIVLAGTYILNGTADGFSCTLTLTAEANYVQDFSFEDQSMSGQEASVQSPWEMTDDSDYGSYGAAHIESKGEGNLDGDKYFHWYSNAAFTFTIQQAVTIDVTGTFTLKTHVMAEKKGTNDSLTLWAIVADGDKQSFDITNKCQGWNSDLETGMLECDFTGVSIAAGSNVVFGMSASFTAGSWGHSDVWSLVQTA